MKNINYDMFKKGIIICVVAIAALLIFLNWDKINTDNIIGKKTQEIYSNANNFVNDAKTNYEKFDKKTKKKVRKVDF